MSKTVTLRLSDRIYDLFRKCSERDNRTLSNFIETATQRYLETCDFVDDREMAEIRENKALNASIRRGQRQAREKKGRFVD